MPASVTDSDDEPIDESREPKTWEDVEDTINDEEEDDADVFLSTLGSESDQKPVTHHEEIPKGRFVDPLGILRMPPRTIKPQSIDDEHFNPVTELSGLHMATQFGDLVQGMRRLARKLSSHEADIKQLVRDNFDRFISCKDVIDGLYELISENEMSAQGTGTGKVEATVREVLARANRVYSPLLVRKAETDKIRQSLSVLSRFSFLFTLPSKIAANIREGEYDKAVQHYKKATSIFQDQAAISHISVFLHVFTEVENIVADFRSTLYSALADPNSSFEAQERVIRILVDLARPSDFRINPSISANDTKDDPGWYYLNMAASRMVARLSGSEVTPATTAPSTAPSTAPTTPSGDAPPIILITSGEIARPPAATLALATSGGIYKSVRSTCGHVARHLPNLWKMGRYYLEGRFDPRNYGSQSDKGKEELQAHPQSREDKDKVDKAATARVFFSDETSSVRVDSRKTCGELVDICLRRVEGEHSPNNYAIFTWIEKRKKDGTKVIKITELGVGEKIHKLHKKWGDKSGHSHKFLFKRKDETFPKTHDPRTIVEDYTLEMRSANDTRKNKEEGGGKSSGGRKGEADFIRLITSVLSVFAERVESLFFLENSEDDFDADLADSSGDQAEEWAFGKMRSQVLDVVTTLNILQRAGMNEHYLLAVNQLVLKLCGHYVTRVCGQWAAEVALLYLSVPSRSNRSAALDASSGVPISSTSDTSVSSITDLPSIFVATTKFYLAQFKGIVAKGHPLMTQIQSAFGEALKCFADTLHHLAFHYVDEDVDEEEKDKAKMHHKLRIVGYIVYTRNMVVGSLWSHYIELFKMSSTHTDEELLASPLEVFRQLGEMAAARYIHDKLTIFNKLLRDGILLNPTTEWTTSTPPLAVSEYAMSVLLQFVYIFAELSVLDSGADNYREQRYSSGKMEKEDLLGGPPFLVINKLIGEMLWGMMEGMQRCVEQLDSGAVSACGVCQLQLDFTFMETVLSKYATEKSVGVAQHIHALLKQMEEEAYQVGAGEDRVEVEIEAIIDDTSRRSALLFASLTGTTDFAAPLPIHKPTSSKPTSSKLPGGLSVPKRKDAHGSGAVGGDRKSALSADLKFGKDSHKLMELQQMRAQHREMEKQQQERQQERQQEKDRQQERQQDRVQMITQSNSKDFEKEASKSRLELLARRGGEKKEEKESELKNSSGTLGNREQEREKLREREREKRLEKEREREREQKEKMEKEQQKQKAPAVEVKSPPIKSPEIKSPDGAMSSREREREKQRERQQAKLKQ